jgi:hypothetical protein
MQNVVKTMVLVLVIVLMDMKAIRLINKKDVVENASLTKIVHIILRVLETSA